MWAWIKDRWAQLLGALAALGALVAFWLRTHKAAPLPVEQTDRVLEAQQSEAERAAAQARARAEAQAQIGRAIEAELQEIEDAHEGEEVLDDEAFAERFNRRHGLREPGAGSSSSS